MRRIAPSTVRRLSLYLQFLEDRERQGQRAVSSRALAEAGGATSAQVRKDLSFFGSFGRRGVGYEVPMLRARLREILGLQHRHRVVVVGAGRIGAALVAYPGFDARGFEIAAVYDTDRGKVGVALDGLVGRDSRDLEADLEREPADIAVIGTPAESAQQVADRLVGAGVRALLNLAPRQLSVPAHVVVKNVNMALELEGLSFALTHGGG